MDIQGQAVRHKTFGCGVVEALAGSVVTVSFKSGMKKFIHPDVFQEHLVFTDSRIQKNMQAKLAEKRAEADLQRRLQQAEQDRLQKLRNFVVKADSHAAFAVSPECVEQVCRTCTVFTGRYLTGCSRGKPRRADRLRPNSACLVTALPAGETEKSRRIIGIFMVREDFFGEDCDTGVIEAHPAHRLLLSAGEALPFWDYFDREAGARWGNTAFKYCSATVINRILSQVVQSAADTEGYAGAAAFYRYFCKRNSVSPLIETEPEEQP